MRLPPSLDSDLKSEQQKIRELEAEVGIETAVAGEADESATEVDR